jgi:L-ascorbate metabolism protein UlaG (beta-lactamase superfamily)
LPVQPFDKSSFLALDDEIKYIWYGHSVLLFRINHKTILIDPMFGDNCSPIAPFPTKRFSENTIDIIETLPEIDLIMLSHDHYDHLDLASIEKLKSKTKLFWVALGVKRHLVRWGIEESRIVEFDWWDEKQFEGIAITYTPTRHFSGRGLSDRLKSLWGGWVLNNQKSKIWFSGDGGYGAHFKEIGERLGPFDLGFMECGQYNDYWHDIHLFPDESAQAAEDACAKKVIPVHWGAFPLSFQHEWYTPPTGFHAETQKRSIPAIFPELGKMYSLADNPTDLWWKAYQ